MIRRALLFSLGQRYLAFALQLGTSMAMARLLTPTEAGIYSLAAVAVTVGHVIRDFGVGDYLVKEREITPEKVRAAFTVTTLFAWATALVFLGLAPVLAAAYGEPGVATVLQHRSGTAGQRPRHLGNDRRIEWRVFRLQPGLQPDLRRWAEGGLELRVFGQCSCRRHGHRGSQRFHRPDGSRHRPDGRNELGGAERAEQLAGHRVLGRKRAAHQPPVADRR
ncbi:MAG: oligosaccharide flippase family protein [Betaproteobacteria bacterium]|nr:oligosaccharide flippase family protein [Betaproteobacteria bacterium]